MNIENILKAFSLKSVGQIILVSIIIYASVTGTNWYNNYHEYKTVADAVDNGAMAKAKAYDTLSTEFEVLQGELKAKGALIEQLKATTLR